MKKLHRISGILVSVFILAHLFNHSMAWFGIATHQSVMETLRKVYRIPIIEVLLVGAFIFQAISGIKLVLKLRKKPNKTAFDKLKLYSGLALGLFVLNHIGATIGQRLYFNLDTNFYFAARVVVQEPLLYFFIPYYFIGVMAFGIHLASIHREKSRPFIGTKVANLHFGLILSVFFLLSLSLLYIFTGGLYAIKIPEAYDVF